MQRFRFRLDRVLSFRERVRDEKREELLRRNFERDSAIEKLKKLREEALTVGMAEGAVYQAHELVARSNYAYRLKCEIEAEVERIVELTRLADEAKDAYIEANREVRVLELLKEKKQAEYNDIVAKEDIKSLDELTTQRYKR